MYEKARLLFTETEIPGQVLYLDCRVLGEGRHEVSWGWPLSSSDTESSCGAILDKTVTHALLEYTEGEHVKQVEVQTSPHVVEG